MLFKAKRNLGQNFLCDENIVSEIVNALGELENQTVIEIGAGYGVLTRRLIARAAKVVAVEFDRDLIPILKKEFGGSKNFTLIEADALKINFSEILNNSDNHATARLVANLPYNISTAILQKLIEQRECFSELILMLQREVVERITAPAGSSERGFLSVLVEAYAASEKLFDVPPAAFRPIPKVWSSVIKLKFNEERLITSDRKDEKFFRQIVSAGFAQKRKTILNNLKNAPPDLQEKIAQAKGAIHVLEMAEIAPVRRAESLTIEEWRRLFDAFA